jgi:hypothetical protein
MSDNRDLRLIGTIWCKEYTCEAKMYVQENHPSGHWHLIARYGDGYSGPKDLPIVDGCREFATGIPNGMSDQAIIDRWLFPPPQA